MSTEEQIRLGMRRTLSQARGKVKAFLGLRSPRFQLVTPQGLEAMFGWAYSPVVSHPDHMAS